MGFENVNTAIEHLDALQARLFGVADAAGKMPPLPDYRLGDNKEEPSSIHRDRQSDLYQGEEWRAANSPEAQAAALRGGAPPGFSAVPVTALPVSPAIYIPPDYSEGARQRREQRAGGWNQAAADAVIAQLEALDARLTQVFGGPTYIGQIIQQEIRNIKAKVLSPDEALAFIRYVLSTMAAGLQQEALSDVSAIRNVANDLLRFAGGAALPGGTGSLVVGPRPAPPPTAEAGSGAATAAGRAGSTVLATRGDVAQLGATIMRGVEQQTAAIGHQTSTAARSIAAVAAQTRDAETARQEANRRLAEDFRAIHGWQTRIENGLLRPMAASVTEIRGFTSRGATVTRELADAMERLQLSGALSPGGTV